MLSTLHGYLHGIVLTPAIIACRKAGLFTAIRKEPRIAFNKLCKMMHANPGHLRTTLVIFESLGWVREVGNGTYKLMIKLADINKIPGEIVELLVFPWEDYMANANTSYSLEKYLAGSKARWGLHDTMLAEYLDGMLCVPLLLALKNLDCLPTKNKTGPNFDRLSIIAKREIISLFSEKKWIESVTSELKYSDTGRFLADRIFNAAVILSYRPMLYRLSEVIFGDCLSVFGKSEDGHETHLDRTLNVRGSGFQHEKYFNDIEETIISIFNKQPISRQPKYISDMGCGNGILLKRIYGTIQSKTVRGSHLGRYPVVMVAADINEKALVEATKTLQNVPCIVLQGDINDPHRLIDYLKKRGVENPDDILHVRSFLDHDRPFVGKPILKNRKKRGRGEISPDFALSVVGGSEISSVDVYESLVCHLEKWSEVVGKHGIIVLEAHSVQKDTVAAYINNCECLHFDAVHRFSGQMLVDAVSFLMAAANCGLFPKPDSSKKYPRTLPFTRITLNYWEKRNYRIRYARQNDIHALVKIEQQCWIKGLRTPAGKLKERIRKYPAGQILIEMGHGPVAVVYSQRIEKLEDLKDTSSEYIDNLHLDKGAVVQLLEINVVPEEQDKNLGDQLLEFMLQKASLTNGVELVVGVTRCKSFGHHNSGNETIHDYIRKKNENGNCLDPILRFHELHGAKIVGTIPNYRRNDVQNEGFGVLIRYDLAGRRAREDRVMPVAPNPRIPAGEKGGTIIGRLQELISALLKSNGDYSPEVPLMDMGLDSADLLELSEKVGKEFQVELDSTFFFTNNTALKISEYLLNRNRPFPGEENSLNLQKNDNALSDGCVEIGTSEKVVESSGQKRDVAIIGISCKLPGGIINPDDLWDALKNSRDFIRPMPSDRWKWPHGIDVLEKHKGIDCGGYLERISTFDASFFNISPKEAIFMDPQQRILLELSWECIENAGYPASELSGSRTGVFIGASGSDYQKVVEEKVGMADPHLATGTSLSVLPNRISYFLNLIGPSIQIDTACSSSLVAVHQAIRSLLIGECEQALCGGVNIICHPSNSIAYYGAGMLSRDGKCRAFDANANGYVRGEGAVIFLLKPLARAVQEGDRIYAVIKGSSINHAGQTNGLTAPSPEKQAELIFQAYQNAKVDPLTVGYVEAHGTGTILGDPIEAKGLKTGFSLPPIGGDRPIENASCGLGSIKTNIGHLEAAAGAAGMLKAVLCLKNHAIPPSLNFSKLNPKIDFSNSPFFIVEKMRTWNRTPENTPRRAGVSSFGSGGSNAHLVIEEWPLDLKKSERRPYNIIAVSAKTKSALKNHLIDLQSWIERRGCTVHLEDISATSLLGRDHFEFRYAFVAKDVDGCIRAIRSFLTKCTDQTNIEEVESVGRGTFSADWLPNQIAKLKSLDPECVECLEVLESLCEMYINGYDIPWRKIIDAKRISFVDFPTYAFKRDEFWIDPQRMGLFSSPQKAERKSHARISDHSVDATEIMMSCKQENIGIIGQATGTIFAPDDSVLESESNNVDRRMILSGVGQDKIREKLLESLAQTLFLAIDEIGLDKKFIEIGMDSVLAVEWAQNLRSKLGIAVEATRIYVYPTVGAFLNYILGLASDRNEGRKSRDAILGTQEESTYDANIEKGTASGLNIACDTRDQAREVGRGAIAEFLADSLKQVLLLSEDQIDKKKTFNDLGVDSVIGVEWISIINKRYGIEVPATKLYEFANIDKMTGFLLDQVRNKNAQSTPVQLASIGGVENRTFESKVVLDLASEDSSIGSRRFDNPLLKPCVTLEAFSGGAYMDKEHSEPIAIIGMSGRYAGAENLEQFWSNLCNAKNSIREIPISRWNLDEEFELMPQKRGKIPCRWIGLMDKAEYFDPLFFNISPSEAENMDPQQRIFLQEGYRAFEDAGYSPKSLDGMKCGVYLGIMSNDYAFMVEKNAGGSSDTTGNDNAIAAARISYFLNLKGPAIALDTACSSSMVAVHLASKALSDREIKMALVGGVTLYLNSQAYLAMCRAGMLSMDGKCRPFDKNANGFIPGEGVGALVLKRLSDAQADRDHIYGILKGSGVNQDGKTNGITAPSMQSQMELEKEVYNRYKISPESISYVEMHGTGTRLGDPIEMEALSTVFTEKTNKRHFCAIGSVKSNIGHSSAAAGIAGIQKVLLCLRHKQLVPTLNYSEPNSHFNLGTSPFYVNTVLREWKADTKEKRRAAVSSFGFSGTNAHVIIDEYPQEKEIFDGEAVQAQEEIFLLSAQSQEQLKAYAIKLKEFIISHNENSLENIAFTLQTGRDAFICRLAILADSRNSLIETLSRFIDDGMSTKIWLSSSGMRPSGLRTSSESGGIATQASTDTMIEKRMLPELGKLWVDGCSIDWAALPRRMKPYRVSLPTYPFAEEYCWVSSKPAGEKVVVNVGLPLENISDLYSVRYSSTFNGGEFYLRDHIVLKQKMLPAAVYLELIRNAYDQASQRNSPDQGVISITDVVWQRPTLVENVPVRLYTELCLGNDSSINFTISQRISDNDIVCCTGKVDRMPHSKPEVIDPRQIQFMCNEGKIGGEEFYKLFRAMGIEYGPAHQCIREINLAANQAIAAVEIPELLSDTQNAFGLHPSLMDSSLQSVLGLARDITAFEKSPVIPYALESLKVYKTLPQKLLVHARQRSLSGESEKLPGYDLDLLSESGELCCRLVGLSLRQFGGKAISGDTLSNFHENTPPDVSSPLQMIESTSRVDPRKEIITEHCVQYLIKLISDTLKIPKFKIDPTEPFSAFGIDSIVVVQLTAALSKSMENVTSNLFFQHQNILSLAEHLVNTQRDHITKIVDAPQKCPSIIESESRACQDTLPTDDAEAGRNSLIGSGVIRLQAQAAISKYQQSDIAVIGLAGRYAQSKNPAELWENLVKGKNCISEVPADRWNWREYFDPEIGKEGTTYTKWGGFIEDICRFDSLFFQISPAEAEKMDPQERAFLEIAFSAIDDAGYSPSSLCETKKVGVFVGAMNSSVPSGGFWSIANRVSFHFNFKGPSMAVDSACSSSLTAVHLAVESIKNGSCECALAGGVNLVVHPRQFLKLAAFRMVSATQECKAFGANADGFVDGEGVGAVVLKPLKKAVEDGDHIYGIIRASGINSGGKTNGYTVPNPNAQAELIAETLRNAGVSADAVSYIEAHGTGTPLGDPIEIAALTMAFDKFTKIKEFCAIGSIKSNIGHCESAAGIAGLTKVLLQLKHRKIVSSLHSSCLNPNINFSNSPFFVQQEVAEWKRPSMVVNGQTKEYPRIAGVSSFGAGGANAHLLVQEYASEDDEGLCRFSNQTPTVIVLSARTPEQLLQKKRDLLYSLRVNKHREKDLARIAYTLQVGREEMTERMGFIVSSIRELEARLEGTLISEGEMRQNPSGDAKQSKRELSQMCSDDDFIVLMESWFSKKKYDSLLGLWLKGFNVNWAKLYQAEHPKRISLPVYPFGGKRFNLQCLAKENQACLFDSQFDEQFFSEMLDGIALGTTSIEDAMRKTGAYFEKGHKVIQKG